LRGTTGRNVGQRFRAAGRAEGPAHHTGLMTMPVAQPFRAALVALASVALLRAQPPASLPPWTPGTLDMFDYFTGGDMPGVPDAGAPAWQSVETAVARALGPTDVHVVNHHGSIDPESDVFLKTLRSPVMILPSW